MKRSGTTFLFLLLVAACVQAQDAVYPNNGTLYDGKLHTVQLLMHPDSLAELLKPENRWTNRSYPATFIYDNQDTLYEVGVRIKGNSSRSAKKLSFKIDVDEFTDQTYQGLKTFNFNGNHNDPSLTREWLSANVMQEAGNMSLRANHIKLFINGAYRGVYSHAEQINKKFLSSRFGSNKGNLYKCSWPADLAWLGNNEQAYKDVINPSPLNERAYELKTNEEEDDYSDLVALINTIHHTPDSVFSEAIDTIFDVEAYLKVLVAEVLIGHWDNYSFNKNNYYLYHHPVTRKFVYLPYDMDNTFGVQWGVSDIDVRDIYRWGKPENGPLTEKILAVPAYKAQYEMYLRQFCTSFFTTGRLYPRIDSVKNYLADAIETDSFYTGVWESDYGYTTDDWRKSYTGKVDDHASIGIRPYIENRIQSVLAQLPSTGLAVWDHKALPLFPNPAVSHFYMEARQAGMLEVFDITGKAVFRCRLLPGSHAIPVSGIPAGLYSVTFTRPDASVLRTKLVIR